MLEDVTIQSQICLKEIEQTAKLRDNERTDGKGSLRSSRGDSRSESLTSERLAYFAAHLESLRLTLAVLLQTLYTAQSIMWSK